MLVCPPDGHVITAAVGCRYAYNLVARATKYQLHLRPQVLSSCKGCAFESADLRIPSCSDVAVDPLSSDTASISCCGNGLCDGLESGSSCPTDCRDDSDDFLTQVQFGSVNNGWRSVAEYAFSPRAGMEGRRLLKCFEGVTNAGASSSDVYTNTVVNMTRGRLDAPTFCMLFIIRRCSYCVPQASTMHSFSSHFLLNMDWLRVYNSNPGVPNPDLLIQNADSVAVGPIYEAQAGDTLLSVAAFAKTTLKAILRVNGDLAVASDGMLQAGQEMCLLVCSSMPLLPLGQD